MVVDHHHNHHCAYGALTTGRAAPAIAEDGPPVAAVATRLACEQGLTMVNGHLIMVTNVDINGD